MQVDHSLDVKCAGPLGINDRLRKAIEVQLAIFPSNFMPAVWTCQNALQRPVKLLEKIIAQARPLPLIPSSSRFQFFFRLRMADDAH